MNSICERRTDPFKYVSVAADGNFTIVKPMIDHMPNSCSGVNMFTNSDGSLYEIALASDSVNNLGGGMKYTVFVKRPDNFSGTVSITQLINRDFSWDATVTLYYIHNDTTDGNFWLDTGRPYSSMGMPLFENGHPTNPVRPVTLADSPGLIEPRSGFYSYANAKDDFHDYICFQPDGGIPVTIARVDWGWDGYALGPTPWLLITEGYYGPTLSPDDDSFPVWPYTYTGN